MHVTCDWLPPTLLVRVKEGDVTCKLGLGHPGVSSRDCRRWAESWVTQ